MSIRSKLLLPFTAFAVAPMVVVGLASYYNSVRAVEAVVEERGLEASRQGADEARQLVARRRGEVELLVRNRDAAALLVAYAAVDSQTVVGLRSRLDLAFRQFLAGPRQLYAQVQYITLDGQAAYGYPEVAALPAPPRPDIGAATGYDMTRFDPAGGTIVVNSFTAELGPLLRLARPVVDPHTQKPVGFVFADLSVDRILAATSFPDVSGVAESAVLIDRQNDRLLHHPNPLLRGLAVASAIPEFAASYERLQPESFALRYNDGSEDWLVSYHNVPDLSWTFAVFTRPARYTSDPKCAAALNLGITLAAVLAALIVMMIVIGRISGSIRRVAGGAEAIAAGDLEQQIEVSAHDETGVLAGAFNHMAASLKTTLGQLHGLTEELEDRVEARTAELAAANERLEGQNRELAIEQALERVRTTAAAMQASRDLHRVVTGVREELRGLGVRCEQVSVDLVDPAARTMRMQMTGGDDPAEVVAPPPMSLDADEHGREYWAHWQQAVPWRRFRSLEDARVLGPRLVENGVFTEEELRQFMLEYPSEGVMIVNVPFAHGALAMNRRGPEPFTDENVSLMSRFTEVFALGYQRHLDLEAAEERARQADVARARQRVRGEVMAMESADDITGVVDVLREELRQLGVPCDQIGVNIVDEEANTIPGVWSAAGADVPADPEPSGMQEDRSDEPTALSRLMEHWRAGRVWNRPRSESDDNPDLVGWVVDVPFEHGTLAMNRGRVDPEAGPFAQDEIDVLVGFAEVFSLGYTRFLDFERLEAQNRALEKANAEVEQANRYKSDFLARMSHDLRTPMNAIIGYTHILLRRAGEVLDPRQYRNLENIDSSAEHLLTLINDILDLSRIESGRVDIRIQEVDLTEVVDQCATSVQPLLKPGVDLHLELEHSGTFATDRDRVQRVLMNLLGNAAKFTDAGHITVGLTRAGGGVELRVADTGSGIPAAELPHIFEEFHQVDGASGAGEGSGLGLAIARKSVEMLGGTIAVDSRVGDGTTFSVRLPATGAS